MAANRGAASQQQKEMIEQAAQVIAQDNTELACAFIQKTAVEKAIPEMDKRLSSVCHYTIQTWIIRHRIHITALTNQLISCS